MLQIVTVNAVREFDRCACVQMNKTIRGKKNEKWSRNSEKVSRPSLDIKIRVLAADIVRAIKEHHKKGQPPHYNDDRWILFCFVFFCDHLKLHWNCKQFNVSELHGVFLCLLSCILARRTGFCWMFWKQNFHRIAIFCFGALRVSLSIQFWWWQLFIDFKWCDYNRTFQNKTITKSTKNKTKKSVS